MPFKDWIQRLRSQVDRHRRRRVREARRTLCEQLDFQPTLARLEDRRVLSVSVGVDAGVVTFQGNEASDSLFLGVDTGGNLQYSCDGGNTWSTDLDSTTPQIEALSVHDIGKVQFFGSDGNDALTVDFGQGSPIPTKGIFFDGGGDSDTLTLTGGGTFRTITHAFTSNSSGNVEISDQGAISYTGLEPISDNLDAIDRVLEFSGLDETMTVSEAGGFTTVDSDVGGETLTFANPQSSLTLRGGAGDDVIDVNSLPNIAIVTIDGQEGHDTFNVRGTPAKPFPWLMTELRGGDGNDVFNFSSDAAGNTGHLDGLVSVEAWPVWIDVDGGEGVNRMVVSDRGGIQTSASVLVDISYISGLGGPADDAIFTYRNLNELTIRTSDTTADIVQVLGTREGTTTIVETGGGNDEIYVDRFEGADSLGDVDAIQGELVIDAGAGVNHLVVSDYAATAANDAVVVTASTITGLAPAKITYTATGGLYQEIVPGVPGIQIHGSNTASDTFDVRSTSSGSSTAVLGNGGQDIVTVGDPDGALIGIAGETLLVEGGAGNDSLELVHVGSAYSTHTYDYADASSGSVTLNEGAQVVTVTYADFEALSNDGTPVDVVFNLPAAADDTVTLSDLGVGQTQLAGASFQDTDFVAPSAGGAITINLGTEGQTLTVTSLTLNGNTDLTINGEGGSDTVRLNAAAGLTVTGNLAITAETIVQSGVVTVNGSASLTVGAAGTASLTNTSNDFQGAVSASGGDVAIADANALLLDRVDAAALDVVAGDDITVKGVVEASDAATLRAGSDGSGSVNVTSAGTLTTANPGSDISLQAGTVSGSIALAGSVTAVDRLTLSSVGGVSQAAAAIRAADLQLTGAGAFSLNQSGNDVDTVAADLNGGSLALTDANSIAIGSVATAGIATGDPSAGGAVTINATSGTITVAGAIDTSGGRGGGIAIRGSVIVDAPVNSGGGAITLNADTVGDSVLEINAGVTSSGGDVEIVNRKAIQIRAPVNNAGSGNTTIASFGGGDLTVAGPVTSGSEAVGGAGNITLQTGGDADGDGTEDGDILIESDMTTYGGLRKEEEETDEGKADEGKIYVDAAGTISVDSGVTIRTGTGQMQGASSADGLAQTPPPISVRLVPVDQGGSNVDSQGHAIVEITVHDPAVLNYQVTIDWADGYDIWGGDDVVIYPLAPSVGEADDFAGFQSGVTYRFDYSYQGKGNPNLLNPSAPIPIMVTIAYDGRADLNGEPLNGIVFREGGKTLESLPVTDVLTVPGTGLFAAIKVVKSEIVPVALRQATGTVPIVAQVAAGSQQTSSYEPSATQLEFVTRTGVQLFFRHVDATGQEGENVDLPPELLERGLFDVFQRFPNGRYRIYLKEANSDHERLIQEVNVYQGRIVPPDFRENASERQMVDEPPRPTEKRPADEPKAEEGRDTEKTEAAKPPVPRAENGPSGDKSAQPAASTGAVSGTAVTLGWAASGGSQRWAEQVDRAFQAGRRSLSRTARLARRLQSG